MASDLSCGFRPGALHISLQIRKTQPKGWRKRTNEQTRAWVSSKRKKGEVYVTHFCTSPCICRLSWACVLRETSTKPLGILTHLWLSSLTASFCRPCPSLDSYLKPTVLFCLPLTIDSLCLLWDLPSLLHFQSRWRSRPQALWVGFTPKQTKRFSDRHQHKRKWMQHIVSHLCLISVTWIYMFFYQPFGVPRVFLLPASQYYLTRILFNTTCSFAHSPMLRGIPTYYQYFKLDTYLKSFKYCYLTRIIQFNIKLVNISSLLCMRTSLSVNEVLLPRYVKWSTNFRVLQCNIEIPPSWFEHMNFFIWFHIHVNASYSQFQVIHQRFGL